MKMRSVAVLVAMAGVLAGCGKDAAASTCDEKSSRLVAKSFVLAIPLLGSPAELRPLMQANPDAFAEKGGAIRCMRKLGATLTKRGAARSKEAGNTSATERFGASMPAGLSHVPGQVDSSLRRYGSDMFFMGEELTMLASVLPAAAKGNFNPYITAKTEARRMMNRILPLYQMMCQADRSSCNLMLSAWRKSLPQVEQQIYTLARQLGD